MSVEPLSSPALGSGLSRVAASPSALSRFRGLVALAYALSDALLASLAFALAYWVRYRSEWVFHVPFGLGRDGLFNLSVTPENQMDFEQYQPHLLLYVACLVVTLTLKGTYTRRFLRALADEAGAIVSSSTIAIAIVIVVMYYYQLSWFSRLMYVYVWLLTIVLLLAARGFGRWVKAQLRERGIGLRDALIVGCGPQARAIMRSLLAQPALGFRVVGFLDDEYRRDLGRIQYLGDPGQLKAVIETRRPDEVIIALPAARHEEIVAYLRECAACGARFRLVPDFYELSLNQVDTQYLDGIPLIGLRDLQLSRQSQILKRGVDIAVSIAALIVTAPVWLLALLLIRLDSPGPVLFKQTRVGKGGREFTLYKFRSMKVGAESARVELNPNNETGGVIFKIRRDPRRTRVGAWLRRLSFDELPQLWNVLRGDMSLVGPRPPVPSEVREYEEWHRRRLDVAPGLTGIWQVSGRSDVPFDEMVLMDLWYIENWSLGLDLKIMLKTVPAVLLARGAY